MIVNYAHRPKVIVCKRKGSPKNNFQILKSFCGACRERKGCQIKDQRKEKSDE